MSANAVILNQLLINKGIKAEVNEQSKFYDVYHIELSLDSFNEINKITPVRSITLAGSFEEVKREIETFPDLNYVYVNYTYKVPVPKETTVAKYYQTEIAAFVGINEFETIKRFIDRIKQKEFLYDMTDEDMMFYINGMLNSDLKLRFKDKGFLLDLSALICAVIKKYGKDFINYELKYTEVEPTTKYKIDGAGNAIFNTYEDALIEYIEELSNGAYNMEILNDKRSSD
jgi:hypothetical protein